MLPDVLNFDPPPTTVQQPASNVNDIPDLLSFSEPQSVPSNILPMVNQQVIPYQTRSNQSPKKVEPPVSLFEGLEISAGVSAKPAVQEKPKSSLWDEAEDLFDLGDGLKPAGRDKDIKSMMYAAQSK